MKAEKLTCIALFICCAAVLSAVETWLPPIVPITGVRVGLGNIVTLFVLYIGGNWRFRDALSVALLRCVIAALITGSVMSAAYGLSGGLLALCGMVAARKLLPSEKEQRYLALVGACGAICHIVGQMMVAVVFYGTMSVIAYTPILMATAVAGGVFTGLCTMLLLAKLPEKLIIRLREL